MTLDNVIKAKEEDSVYSMYYDFNEPVSKIANHRILAVNRGEKEGFLSVKLEADEDTMTQYLKNEIVTSKSPCSEYIEAAAPVAVYGYNNIGIAQIAQTDQTTTYRDGNHDTVQPPYVCHIMLT